MSPRRRKPLAELIIDLATDEHRAPRTVTQLAKRLELPERSLRNICARAGTSPKAVLDFIACFKAVEDRDHDWDPSVLLCHHRVDERSVSDLIEMAGFDPKKRPTPEEYLDRRGFIEAPELREQLRRLISSRRAKKSSRT